MSPDKSDGDDEWKFGPEDFDRPHVENLSEEELEDLLRQRQEVMTDSSPSASMVVTFLIGMVLLTGIVIGPVLAVWWFFSFEATVVAIGVMFLWLRFVLPGAFEE